MESFVKEIEKVCLSNQWQLEYETTLKLFMNHLEKNRNAQTKEIGVLEVECLNGFELLESDERDEVWKNHPSRNSVNSVVQSLKSRSEKYRALMVVSLSKRPTLVAFGQVLHLGCLIIEYNSGKAVSASFYEPMPPKKEKGLQPPPTVPACVGEILRSVGLSKLTVIIGDQPEGTMECMCRSWTFLANYTQGKSNLGVYHDNIQLPTCAVKLAKWHEYLRMDRKERKRLGVVWGVKPWIAESGTPINQKNDIYIDISSDDEDQEAGTSTGKKKGNDTIVISSSEDEQTSPSPKRKKRKSGEAVVVRREDFVFEVYFEEQDLDQQAITAEFSEEQQGETREG